MKFSATIAPYRISGAEKDTKTFALAFEAENMEDAIDKMAAHYHDQPERRSISIILERTDVYHRGAVERARQGFDERDRLLIAEGLEALPQLTQADYERVQALLTLFGGQ